MKTMVLLSVLLAAIGIGAVTWRKKSLPDSISAMVYELSNGGKYVWTAWLWAVGCLLMPAMFEYMHEPLKPLVFLWTVSLMFCGAMPLTEADTKKWHDVLGIEAGVLSQVCVWFISPLWLLVWLLYVVLVIVLTVGYDKPWVRNINARLEGKGVFLVELFSALSTWGALLFNG